MKTVVDDILEKYNPRPVVFRKTLVPVYYPEGTLKSLAFLDHLISLGDTCDIFVTDTIKNLLLYK